jgi:hypothetical protein
LRPAEKFTLEERVRAGWVLIRARCQQRLYRVRAKIVEVYF